MASPIANGHPSTPPPSDPSASNGNGITGNGSGAAAVAPIPDLPLTSLTDDGTARRPRDARLIHLVLSSLGIHSYQERVPLQLLDFAYRYTSSVLSDSLRLAGEGYTAQIDRGGRGRGGGGAGAGAGAGSGAAAAAAEEGGQITVTALRQAIASRQGYTFQGPYLPKEFMLEQAAERNRVALPKVEKGVGMGSLQLPPEKYCLTGASWGLRDEWGEEDEEEEEEEYNDGVGMVMDDENVGGVQGGMMEEDDDGDEEGEGRMEDVFGEDGGGDASMAVD